MRKDIGEQLRELRIGRSLSQVEVAEQAWCDLRSVERVEEGEVWIGVAATIARVVGARIRVVGADGAEVELGWDPRRLTVEPWEGRVREVVEDLARVSSGRRSRAETHLEVSHHYRAEVEGLWGRSMEPEDTWSRMPRVGGLLLSLTPHIGDEVKLVRSRPWRGTSLLERRHVVPPHLSAEEGEVYRTLRGDGVEMGEAERLARAVS